MKVKGLTALLLLTAASLSSAQSRQDLLLEQKREKAERLVEESASRSEKRIRALEKSRFPKNIFVKGFHGVRPLIGGMPSGSGAVAGIGYVRGLDYELVNIEANARYSSSLGKTRETVRFWLLSFRRLEPPMLWSSTIPARARFGFLALEWSRTRV